MGSLTTFLQREFVNNCPPGWNCRHEIRLLTSEQEKFLGYSPRVDVLLEREDHSQRLWIEFEVSRADPVANHTKFATAHLFQPQSNADTFVSMVSPHVARGRYNLAASTIFLMRYIGMNAFQTVLFPQFSPSEIKQLNHLDQHLLYDKKLDVKHEIERAMSVSQALLRTSKYHIHFVGNLMEIMLNLRRWNKDLKSSEGRRLWGKRTVTYFVFDPHTKCFAPSKFCAYLKILKTNETDILLSSIEARSEMTAEFYTTIDGTDSRFDGQRAWKHLVNNLAMVPTTPKEALKLLVFFEKWLSFYKDSVTVHPTGPTFLVPPGWFK